MRCKQLGLYKLLGTANPRCQNGNWTTRLPSCVPTTLLTNFTGAFTSFKNQRVFNELKIAEDSPPTILIKIPSGSASMEPGGELAVFPGSTLHLECLYPRRVGSPDWTWTTTSGQYRTGMFQLHYGKFSNLPKGQTVVLALNLFKMCYHQVGQWHLRNETGSTDYRSTMLNDRIPVLLHAPRPEG